MLPKGLHQERYEATSVPQHFALSKRHKQEKVHHFIGLSSKDIVGIARMGKLPDLDVFDRGQIVGVRRMGHSISEIVRQLGFSRSTASRVYQEYMDGGQKLAIGQTAKNN
ncbi:hypothetical protein TNCV_5012391 [Trichonephila clavipes]|nr:hypothetical protein TNCV_5012391 [Trichonephila clavipes]